MSPIGPLGLALAALAGAAFVAERRAARKRGRRMRVPFVITDLIGAAFGLVVAAIAFLS